MNNSFKMKRFKSIKFQNGSTFIITCEKQYKDLNANIKPLIVIHYTSLKHEEMN